MAKPVAIPLTISILLHLAVVLLLAFNLTFSSPPVVVQPKIIQAKLISMEQLPALRAQPQPVTQAMPAPVDTPKPEPKKPEPVKTEPPKPEPQKPEPPKPAPPKAEPKPEPPKPDLAKLKQIEQQKLIEKAKADAEQKKIVEQKKQEEERKRKENEEAQRKKSEQQEKNELAKQMAAEDNAMSAARDQEAVASYAGQIQHDIQNNWSRPPSARIGMHVTLLIQLIPSGDVINVSVLNSSGNDAFDRSAEDAVRRVGKFSYLKEMSDKSPEVFERNFRRLQLVFTPEDLRQ